MELQSLKTWLQLILLAGVTGKLNMGEQSSAARVNKHLTHELDPHDHSPERGLEKWMSPDSRSMDVKTETRTLASDRKEKKNWHRESVYITYKTYKHSDLKKRMRCHIKVYLQL